MDDAARNRVLHVFPEAYMPERLTSFFSGNAALRCLALVMAIGCIECRCIADELDNQRERRCGQLVAMTALQFFNVNFSLDAIENDLKIGKDGINLYDIQRLLAAHGLNVSGRKGASAESLVKHITSERIAILPVRVRNGTLHYVLLMKRPKDDRVLLVDPLVWAGGLEEHHENILKSANEMCLLVQAPVLSAEQRVKAASVNVSFERPICTLAPIRTDVDGFTDVSLSLRNLNAQSIAISNIIGSCGCTVPKSDSMLIDSGGTLNVNVKINNRAWGKGLQRRAIVVECHGLRLAQTEIVAEGISVQERLGLSLHPASLQMRLSAADWVERQVNKVPPIHASVEILVLRGDATKFLTDSNRSFISTDTVKQGKDGIRLDVRLNINDELFKALSNSNSRAAAEISIRPEPDDANVKYPVEISRESLYGFSQTAYRYSKSVEQINLTLLAKSSQAHAEFGETDVHVALVHVGEVTDRCAVSKIADGFVIALKNDVLLNRHQVVVQATVVHDGRVENSATVVMLEKN